MLLVEAIISCVLLVEEMTSCALLVRTKISCVLLVEAMISGPNLQAFSQPVLKSKLLVLTSIQIIFPLTCQIPLVTELLQVSGLLEKKL